MYLERVWCLWLWDDIELGMTGRLRKHYNLVILLNGDRGSFINPLITIDEYGSLRLVHQVRSFWQAYGEGCPLAKDAIHTNVASMGTNNCFD